MGSVHRDLSLLWKHCEDSKASRKLNLLVLSFSKDGQIFTSKELQPKHALTSVEAPHVQTSNGAPTQTPELRDNLDFLHLLVFTLHLCSQNRLFVVGLHLCSCFVCAAVVLYFSVQVSLGLFCPSGCSVVLFSQFVFLGLNLLLCVLGLCLFGTLCIHCVLL